MTNFLILIKVPHLLIVPVYKILSFQLPYCQIPVSQSFIYQLAYRRIPCKTYIKSSAKLPNKIKLYQWYVYLIPTPGIINLLGKSNLQIKSFPHFE